MKGKSAVKKGSAVTNIGTATPEERAHQCAREVNDILQRYNCSMDVAFKHEKVLNASALVYQINIQPNQ